MSDALSYVYGVTRGPDEVDLDGVRGIEGAAVRRVDAAGLGAVVSDVDRAVFAERALAERLDDLEWLAATARAHHHVVDAVGRRHLVAPLALATVYYDDDRVREVLTTGRAGLAAILDRLDGHAEFGVKIYARRDGAAPPGERPRSGAEYLRARRRALRDGDAATEEARRAADEVDETLGGLAVAARTHRLQDATLSGVAEPMLANRAFLVADTRAADLAAAVAGYAAHPRVRVELTGPWVPYSFVPAASS